MKHVFRTRIVAVLALLVTILTSVASWAAAPKRDFYQLVIYRLKTAEQESRLDNYLQNAYMPALHRAGIEKVGVFKPIIATDAAEPAEKLVYVFIPFKSQDEWAKLEGKLALDKTYLEDGKDYIDTPWDKPVYTRMESILMRAFVDQPHFQMPALSSPKSERVYEFRSYEGPSEKLYVNKVDMFNAGGEVKLFKRLNFNAVFYSEVISGAAMPNLIYMTTFENKADRDAHWKAFSADPEWKTLSAMPKYQHNVSKNDTRFLRPTDYSDI
ncbi:NIPSNAP family containing protein [Emticicia sp. ODNR4P]|nr:NIPSNAP family containing protein [Emticicia sp. ODNR4P]